MEINIKYLDSTFPLKSYLHSDEDPCTNKCVFSMLTPETISPLSKGFSMTINSLVRQFNKTVYTKYKLWIYIL